MPKSYSCDLRERVIEMVEAGASRHEAAEHFGVSVSSVVKWMQCWNESRSPAPKPRGGSISPLEQQAGRIAAGSDLGRNCCRTAKASHSNQPQLAVALLSPARHYL